ncbi:MAG: hypothetical protein H8E55_52055 [Pelagibacterales bacterium]|nr:hypothetical protein [Pelagibacterales bacterium]
MTEPKKFTQEELDEITALQTSNAQKVTEFGQIELELMLTDQRKEMLTETKQKLQGDYKNLQTQEQELVRKLNEKYGAGTVDLSSGEFIPNN